jgi:hypothetical protein
VVPAYLLLYEPHPSCSDLAVPRRLELRVYAPPYFPETPYYLLPNILPLRLLLVNIRRLQGTIEKAGYSREEKIETALSIYMYVSSRCVATLIHTQLVCACRCIIALEARVDMSYPVVLMHL